MNELCLYRQPEPETEIEASGQKLDYDNLLNDFLTFTETSQATCQIYRKAVKRFVCICVITK